MAAAAALILIAYSKPLNYFLKNACMHASKIQTYVRLHHDDNLLHRSTPARSMMSAEALQILPEQATNNLIKNKILSFFMTLIICLINISLSNVRV